MYIEEIKDKNTWNGIISGHDGSLLQSWQWGELQRNCQRKVWRLAFRDGDNFVLAAQIIKHTLPFNKSYLYCPRGPVGKFKFAVKKLLKYLKTVGKKEKAIFFRVDPEVEDGAELFTALRKSGFKLAKKQVQPQNTLMLDLAKSEDDLLAGMHRKARYNIRLAQRRGVTIRQSVDPQDVDTFFDLMRETTKRDRFSSHLPEYYQKQVEILGQDNLLKLFLAEYEGQIIAVAIVSFFGNRATYLHGASSYQHRNLMAPHLVQWAAIKEAQKRGCSWYDFNGIAPSDAGENHPWAGVTRFKRGFGGQEKNWTGTLDLSYSCLWHRLYNFRQRF